MNIGIIGAGNVGKALGASFTRGGHRVSFGSKTMDSARSAAQVVDGHAFSVREAAQRADLIVLAVPHSAMKEVARQIAEFAGGKVVVDVSNPLKDDFSGLVTEGTSMAEQLATWLPDAYVVKAFNTLFAKVQEDPSIHGLEVDALYATDHEQARDQMDELIRSMGLRPVCVGPIARARELEALGFMLISLEANNSGHWWTSISLIGAPESPVEHGAAAGTESEQS